MLDLESEAMRGPGSIPTRCPDDGHLVAWALWVLLRINELLQSVVCSLTVGVPALKGAGPGIELGIPVW